MNNVDETLAKLLDGIDDARRDHLLAETAVKTDEMWREIMGNGQRGLRDRLTSVETKIIVLALLVLASPVVALIADDIPGRLP